MSRDDVRAEEVVEALRARFATALCEALGDLPPAQAMQMADGLCTIWMESLAGLRVTHRAEPTSCVDGAAIARAWHDGLQVTEIMRRHGCSRATAYRYHPTHMRRQARRKARPESGLLLLGEVRA